MSQFFSEQGKPQTSQAANWVENMLPHRAHLNTAWVVAEVKSRSPFSAMGAPPFARKFTGPAAHFKLKQKSALRGAWGE